MSETIAHVNHLLPNYRQSRLKFCGAAMPTMLRIDDSRIDGATFRCGDRFCEHCDRCRSQRVYACIMSATSGVLGGPRVGVMVTLTHQKLPGLTSDALLASRELQSRIQAEAHRRLRRHDYAIRQSARQSAARRHHKSDEWLAIARATLPRFDPATCYESEPAPLSTNRYSGLNPASTDGATTYIWAREVTPGGSTRYAGWHVHAHYLVPTESDAHRLVSAHLAACRALGVRADVAQQRISRPSRASWRGDGDADARDAVGYITQYITKCEIPDGDEGLLRAFIYGIRGMRQYDAAGAWRPIGVGKKRDESAPRVVSVLERVRCVTLDGEVVERALTRDIGDFMAQKTPWWHGFATGTLNQYRTNSTDYLIPVGMVEIAEKFGIGWKLPSEISEKLPFLGDFDDLPDSFLTPWRKIV